MSYIIAFVEFTTPGNTYSVECLRTDIKVGDAVLVQVPNKRITPATVVHVGYLNWNCAGQIKGKLSEGMRGDDGYWTLKNSQKVIGFATNDVFIAELKRRGWVSLKHQQTYRAALTNSNQTLSANVLVRKNGIDLQLLPARRATLPTPLSVSQESLTEGRVVRHHFAHTTFNLYEGILRFATSFMSDEDNYDRFFEAVGVRDRRTEPLKQKSESRRRARAEAESDGLSDYYEMVSDGSGSAVYGGDGMWIGAGGRLHDWGR